MTKYHEEAVVPENCEREFFVFWSSAAETILPETHYKKMQYQLTGHRRAKQDEWFSVKHSLEARAPYLPAALAPLASCDLGHCKPEIFHLSVGVIAAAPMAGWWRLVGELKKLMTIRLLAPSTCWINKRELLWWTYRRRPSNEILWPSLAVTLIKKMTSEWPRDITWSWTVALAEAARRTSHLDQVSQVWFLNQEIKLGSLAELSHPQDLGNVWPPGDWPHLSCALLQKVSIYMEVYQSLPMKPLCLPAVLKFQTLKDAPKWTVLHYEWNQWWFLLTEAYFMAVTLISTLHAFIHLCLETKQRGNQTHFTDM